MGALPKNKITSVEQGKRRRGNSPKLKKDTHARVPLHKKGFFSELFKFLGLESSAKTAAKPAAKAQSEAKKAKSETKTTKVVAKPKAKTAPTKPTVKVPERVRVKPTRVTQHKG